VSTQPTNDLLSVAEGPHWRDGSTLASTQWLWLLGLLPAAVASVVWMGWPALRVLALAGGTAVACDALAQRVAPTRDHTANWSSLSLGLMLAFLLPVNAPWWLVVVGIALTVFVGKKLYGGWGGYPVHPVALGYAMLAVSWPQRLDRTAAMIDADWLAVVVEPLRLLKTQGTVAQETFAPLDLLLGQQAAGVASGMVLWLVLGGLILVITRVVPWQIPLGSAVGVVLGAWLVALMAPDRAASPTFHLLAGSTAFMSFFLLGESTTSPSNRWPMLFYGLLAGILLVLIRSFSTHAESTVFTVLLMNLASPLLDRITPGVRGAEVVSDA
jgi:electron transport complex protein RnfD